MKSSVKRNKSEIKKTRAIKNIFYSVHMMWDVSRKSVFHAAIAVASDYFAWVFYSLFFILYLVGAIENQESFNRIFQFILIAGVVFMVLAFYRAYIDGAYLPMASSIIYKVIYRRLYQKARNVELRCFEDSSFYNKYTLAVDGADEKLVNILINFFSIFSAGIAAIVVFAKMYQIDRVAMLFVFFPIIGNFVFGYYTNKLIFKRDQSLVPYKRRIDYVNRVMYLSDYSKEMRLSNVFNLMKHKYQKAIEGIHEVVDTFAPKINVPLWFRNYFTFTIIFEGVLMYGAYRMIVKKAITLSELAMLSSAMVSATWILIRFTEHIMECMKQALFVENLRTFLDYEERLPEDWDGIMPEDEIHSIEFRNVSFAYKEGANYTIKNMSFQITGKSSVALVGHNGAGKTTIIKLLFRLYDPTEGEILLNGRNIKEYNLKAYRKLFAAAFQDYKIFAFSIKENVLMHPANHTKDEDELVIDALTKAGIYERVKALPKGINTVLTKEFEEEGALLSGGEYQKIVVARAFAKNVPIKVFDEPSSALDPIAEYDLYESIQKDSIGKTMIFISHRLSSVRNADMVYMLENGEIIEEGTHQELIALKGAYADMYNKQAKNYLAVEDLKEVLL